MRITGKVKVSSVLLSWPESHSPEINSVNTDQHCCLQVMSERLCTYSSPPQHTHIEMYLFVYICMYGMYL